MYLGLLPIFQLGVCFVIVELYELYVLEIKLLSVASFKNIFSHSIGCLCVLFMVSFDVHTPSFN